MLKEIARRLTANLRGGDLVRRFIGDKFGVALVSIRDTSGLTRALEKVRSVFRKPFGLDGEGVYVEANVGVALFPKDGEDPADLVRKAKLALSKAREAGIGSVAFFSEESEREITEVVLLKTSLRGALNRGEIVPYYQPVFRLSDLKLVGVEALARWRHPKLGTVSPTKFIPITEDAGLILELGQRILDRSTMELSSLLSEGYDLSLGVNFSMKQFLDERLSDRIEEALQTYRFPEDRFILEITESTAMKDPERTKKILTRIKQLGIKIAIDDFGTGYSSMNYLLEFDVDKK